MMHARGALSRPTVGKAAGDEKGKRGRGVDVCCGTEAYAARGFYGGREQRYIICRISGMT